MTEYVDATPTWRGILPLLVEAATQGTTSEGRGLAMSELERLADMADNPSEHVRALCVALQSFADVARRREEYASLVDKADEALAAVAPPGLGQRKHQ